MRTRHEAHVDVATRAVVGASLAIDVDAFTLERVVTVERAVFEAATPLRSGSGLLSFVRGRGARRAATGGLRHLGAAHDLAIVTGIAGAVKSRLQRDVAAAYSEAGFRVIGIAVAGDAARTLGEEAAIDARSVARLIVDLEQGRDRLDNRSVLIIDEAGDTGRCASAGSC